MYLLRFNTTSRIAPKYVAILRYGRSEVAQGSVDLGPETTEAERRPLRLERPSKSHKFRLVSKLSIRNYDFSRGAKQFKNYKSFSTLASRAAGGIAPTA